MARAWKVPSDGGATVAVRQLKWMIRDGVMAVNRIPLSFVPQAAGAGPFFATSVARGAFLCLAAARAAAIISGHGPPLPHETDHGRAFFHGDAQAEVPAGRPEAQRRGVRAHQRRVQL